MHVASFLHGSLNAKDFGGWQLRWHSSMTIWYAWFCGFCPWPTMGARSGLDVFCVTILAGVLEIRQFADFIVGNKCVQTPVLLNLIESSLVEMENTWSKVGIGRATCHSLLQILNFQDQLDALLAKSPIADQMPGWVSQLLCCFLHRHITGKFSGGVVSCFDVDSTLRAGFLVLAVAPQR